MNGSEIPISQRAEAKLIIFRQLFMAKLAEHKAKSSSTKASLGSKRLQSATNEFEFHQNKEHANKKGKRKEKEPLGKDRGIHLEENASNGRHSDTAIGKVFAEGSINHPDNSGARVDLNLVDEENTNSENIVPNGTDLGLSSIRGTDSIVKDVTVHEPTSRTATAASSNISSSTLRHSNSSLTSNNVTETDERTLTEVTTLLKSGRDDLIATYKINHVTNILRNRRRARLKEAALKGRRLTVNSEEVALLKYLLIMQIKAHERRERDVVTKDQAVSSYDTEEEVNSINTIEREKTEDVGEDVEEEMERTFTPEIVDIQVSDQTAPSVKTRSKKKRQLRKSKSHIKMSSKPAKLTKAQRNALLRKALREAMEKRERVPLEEAILDFLYFKVKDKDDDLPKAMAQLDVIKTQSALEDALKKKNTERVQYAISYCERRDYDNVMKPLLRRANTFMIEASQTEEKICNPRQVIKNSSEIRRYSYPQDIIHAVTKATLLLLQEPEGRTKRWQRCQALLTPLGGNGLYKKTRRFEVDAVHSQIVARAKDLLSGIEEEDVTGTSECLEALYKWSKAMIEEYEIRNGPVDDVKPANRRSQRGIIKKFTDEGEICKDSYKPLVLPVLACVNTGGEAIDKIKKLPHWSTPRELKIPDRSLSNITSVKKVNVATVSKYQKRPKSQNVAVVENKEIFDLDQGMENSTSTGENSQSENRDEESGLGSDLSEQGTSGLFSTDDNDCQQSININRRRSRSNSLIVSSDGWKQLKMYPRARRVNKSFLPQIDQQPLVTRKN